MESDYRQVVGAVFEEFGAARDAAQIFPRRLDRFDDGHERSNVDLFPYPQDLTIENGQRQRQPDTNGAALTLDAEYLNMAAQIIDVAPDDVHPDAAARYVADGIRGRKAGDENQIVDLLVGQQRIRVHEAALACLRQNAILPEARAVIFHLDDDASALVKRVEFQRSGFALPRGQALLGRFQPVIEGIAHEMYQRVADFLQHRLIQFRIFAA